MIASDISSYPFKNLKSFSLIVDRVPDKIHENTVESTNGLHGRIIDGQLEGCIVIAKRLKLSNKEIIIEVSKYK